MRDKLAKLAAIGAVIVIVAAASVYGDRKIEARPGIQQQIAAMCQEDEVYAWISNDTRGCVNYDQVDVWPPEHN